jgi:uncharacterized membrane protein
MSNILKVVAEYVAYAAEALAALIIAFGALKAIWTYFRHAVTSKGDPHQSCRCRIQLGHSLSLALEFLVGADILKTAIAPSWSEIGQLAAIIGIRTILNFFLMWELRQSEKESEINS